MSTPFDPKKVPPCCYGDPQAFSREYREGIEFLVVCAEKADRNPRVQRLFAGMRRAEETSRHRRPR